MSTGQELPDRTDPAIVQVRNAVEIIAGLKPARGTVTLSANPSDGDTITISDGTTSNVFEFDNDSTITGDVLVTIGVDAAATIANFITAVNTLGIWTRDSTEKVGVDPVRVDATAVSGSDAANLLQTRGGTIGNVTITKSGATITVTGMTGGSNMGNVPTDADVDIGDVHLLNTSDVQIDPATEQKQDDIITAIGGIAGGIDDGDTVDTDTQGGLMIGVEGGGGASLPGTARAVSVDATGRLDANPISGQAGVTGGSGVIGAATQRVTVATDDTVATDLTAIKTAAELIDDGIGTDGGAEVTKAMAIGGNDGANFQVLKVNPDGELVVNLETADIEIGAVELKNATTDDRALISDADAVRATTDHVLEVQHLDATGKVQPAGDAVGNAIHTAIGDGTTEVDVIAATAALKGDVSSIAGTATNVNGGNRDAGTQTTTLADDDPAVTSLGVIDDWDESDRAKVNLIAGQAGIAGGTGVDGASVPRVSLATDVALPAGTNTIGKATILDDSGNAISSTAEGGPVRGLDASVKSIATTEKAPGNVAQTVAAPGTGVAIGAGGTNATWFILTAQKVTGANTGDVYVGTSSVDRMTNRQIVLAPGESFDHNAAAGTNTDLNDWYVDADNAGDGVTCVYMNA